jgi:hypothetical protein
MILSLCCSGLFKAWAICQNNWSDKNSRPLYSFCQFCCHTGIHFDSGTMFCLFQDSYSKIPCSRTNFKDSVCWLKVCLCNTFRRMSHVRGGCSLPYQLFCHTSLNGSPLWCPTMVTHPWATSGFLRICWPNLSVLNSGFRPEELPVVSEVDWLVLALAEELWARE